MDLPLLQSWRPLPEPSFHPGTARFRFNGGMLILEADLEQPLAPVTSATHNQQRLWELGDVAEFFIQRAGEGSYREYQVAPNGSVLSLLYPDGSAVASVRSGTQEMEDYLSEELPQTSVAITPRGWSVTVQVPLVAFPGERFRVSCCRYDYSKGGAPILSSTSPHPARDFHRAEDWREFDPVAG